MTRAPGWKPHHEGVETESPIKSCGFRCAMDFKLIFNACVYLIKEQSCESASTWHLFLLRSINLSVNPITTRATNFVQNKSLNFHDFLLTFASSWKRLKRNRKKKDHWLGMENKVVSVKQAMINVQGCSEACFFGRLGKTHQKHKSEIFVML